MALITTATGKEFEVDMVCTIPSPPYAYLRIINSDIETIRNVFSNPEETVLISYGDAVIMNHTKLGYAVQEDVAVKVRLEANG